MDKIVCISIVLAFLTGVGLSSMYFSNLKPEVTINRTDGDEITKVEPPKYNYIQANYEDVNYSLGPESVTVKEVDQLVSVYGSSMRPTAFTGHTFLATEYDNQSLEEGTIVTTSGGVAHRIEADYVSTSGYYMVRGDNGDSRERVSPEEIEMVVIGVLYTEDRD